MIADRFTAKKTTNGGSVPFHHVVKNEFIVILLLLLLVTIFLLSRLIFIDRIPGSLYWDEASIGYNAFSILKTGRDEWSEFLPIHFKAFGEYKLPVYIYSVALFEYFFGLSAIAIRLPAVIYSLGTVFVLFFLTLRLTGDKKIGLVSVFLFVISPWFFLFSRTGYEVTAGLFFFLLGVLFFLLGTKSRLFIVSSAASFLLAIYSYNSFRILIPFVGLLLFSYLLIFERFKIKKYFIPIGVGILLFIIGCIPIISLYQSADGLRRFADVGIYHRGDSKLDALELFSTNYFSHFSPVFLFFEGDHNLRSHTGGVGQVFWVQSLFIIIGLISVIKMRSKQSLILLGLLIIAPIPAAVTKESPHGLRSVLMIIPLSILSAIGITHLSQRAKFQHVLFGFILTIFSFLFLVYFYRFLTVYPSVSAQSWQSEYHSLFSAYGERFSLYEHILVSDRYAQPYIFYLYEQQIDPLYFQTNRLLQDEPRSATSVVKQLGSVQFSDITFQSLPKGRSLIFAHPEEKLDEILPVETIWNPDKTVAFYIYDYEKK